jgi:hypothetical protein
MPVRHRIEDALGQQRPEELDLLLVAGRAKPAALAGEGQQTVLLAVIASDAGEAAGQVPPLEELLDHLLDDFAHESCVYGERVAVVESLPQGALIIGMTI